MVAINERRQGTSIIQKILKKAQVPPTWYSIAKPFECRLSVTDEKDGIHVFIPERGERIGENIHHDWYEAIKDIADYVGPKYKKAIELFAKEERRNILFAQINAANAKKRGVRVSQMSASKDIQYAAEIRAKVYAPAPYQEINGIVADTKREVVARQVREMLRGQKQIRNAKHDEGIRLNKAKEAEL